MIYPLSKPYAQQSEEANLQSIQECVELVGLKDCVERNGGLRHRFVENVCQSVHTGV